MTSLIGLLACVGLATATALGASDTCVLFDGSSGRVVIGDSAGINFDGPYTLEAWIKPSRITGESQQVILKWSYGITYPNQRSYLLAVVDSQLRQALNRSGLVGDSVVSNGPGVVAGEWQHVAGVFDGANMTSYINGVAVAMEPAPDPPFAGSSPVNIGGQNSPAYQPFDGCIDEVRISDIARYTSDFTPSTVEFVPDAHTVVLVHFNEGAGSSAENQGTQGSGCSLDPGVAWATGSPLVVPPPPCPGDIDGDADTDVFDFGVLATYFGEAVPLGTNGDLDGDGQVSVFDFGIMANDFGCIP